MAKTFKTLVIGRRDNGQTLNIGGELCTLLVEPNWYRCGVLTSTTAEIRNESGRVEHPYDSTNPVEFRDILCAAKPDIGFICIPTRDKGETALAYTNMLLDVGAKVVSAEKGMAAWQFGQIKSRLDCIDLGAAVGGGNAFLYTLKRRHLRDKRVTIRAVLNATNNSILWKVNGGSSIQGAVSVASKIGIAEPLKPGEKPRPLIVINGERYDKLLKICAFVNFVLARDTYLTPSDFGEFVDLDERDLSRLISVNDRRRLIVTITNDVNDIDDDKDLIGAMRATLGEYHICVGFKSIKAGSVLDKFMPPDVDNGVLLTENGHVYSMWGPGAGSPTIDALMNGAKELCGID